jgi:hypothetical protein
MDRDEMTSGEKKREHITYDRRGLGSAFSFFGGEGGDEGSGGFSWDDRMGVNVIMVRISCI